VKRVGDSYLNEKAQGQFCLVKMRVKNVGKEPIHFSDENQALVDTKGKQYSPDDEAWIYIETIPTRTAKSIQATPSKPRCRSMFPSGPSLTICC
jgi:hypothetical protein